MINIIYSFYIFVIIKNYYSCLIIEQIFKFILYNSVIQLLK